MENATQHAVLVLLFHFMYSTISHLSNKHSFCVDTIVNFIIVLKSICYGRKQSQQKR